jgi:hypothetical protein
MEYVPSENKKTSGNEVVYLNLKQFLELNKQLLECLVLFDKMTDAGLVNETCSFVFSFNKNSKDKITLTGICQKNENN